MMDSKTDGRMHLEKMSSDPDRVGGNKLNQLM